MAARPLDLLTRALDPAIEPPDDATSERILDAALALAAASGLAAPDDGRRSPRAPGSAG